MVGIICIHTLYIYIYIMRILANQPFLLEGISDWPGHVTKYVRILLMVHRITLEGL